MADIVGIVEKLLAKAERTDNQAEKETYLGKAQELITKHAIEQELIERARVARGEERQEAIAVAYFCQERNTKLIKAKRQLVMWLAQFNNGYVVMGAGRSYLMVTAHESDLRMIQALYASMLTQMNTAMSQAEDRGEVVGALQGWRVSYAHGYVTRLAVRLLEAQKRAQGEQGPGTDVVLANREARAKNHYEEEFGAARKGRRIPTSDNNAYGRATGYADGARADLGGQRLGGGRREVTS